MRKVFWCVVDALEIATLEPWKSIRLEKHGEDWKKEKEPKSWARVREPLGLNPRALRAKSEKTQRKTRKRVNSRFRTQALIPCQNIVWMAEYLGLEFCILYIDFTRMLYYGKQIKANKFPHDSNPIHLNYNLSNSVC